MVDDAALQMIPSEAEAGVRSGCRCPVERTPPRQLHAEPEHTVSLLLLFLFLFLSLSMTLNAEQQDERVGFTVIDDFLQVDSF